MKRPVMFVFAVICSLAALTPTAQAQGRPHVLVIISDDAGYADFGFQGSKKIPTPNFDKLAARGVVFSNAYAGSVCSPSRAMLATGMYTARIGYSNNISSTGFVTKPITDTPTPQGLPNHAVTIWERMQSAGYRTACIGKWHLGAHPDGIRDGKPVPGNVPQNQGVEHFHGIIAGSRSFWVGEARGSQALRLINSNGKGKVDQDKVVEADFAGQYITDTFGDMTVDYIRKHAGADKPFFLYSSFTAPHNPMHATKEDIAAIAKLGHGFKKNREIQAAMQLALDRNIGKILDALDDPDNDGDNADSIRDSTLVVFVNDNGGDSHDSNPNYSSNFPLRHGKGSQWEGGIRVPMILAGAGLGEAYQDDGVDVFDHPVHVIDILPTAFRAGGGAFTKDDVIDGVDLLPFLNDSEKGPPHKTLFLRRYSGGQHAVRQGDYKLIYRPTDGYLLFDVVNDPGEKTDLARQKPGLVEQMKRVMTDYDVLMDKPRYDNMALKANRFYDFRFREGVDKSARWSEKGIWIDSDKPVQGTLTPYDSSPNTVLVFRNRDNGDYESINDLRRVGGQPFIANRIALIARETELKGRGAGTIAGQPVLLCKDLKGRAPKLALHCTKPDAGKFTFDLRLDLHLYDNLQVLGDGNQAFEITGDLIEVRKGLTLTKTGSSTLTINGNNGLTGGVNVKQGQVLARNGESLGHGSLRIGSGGRLICSRPLKLAPDRHVTIALEAEQPDQPAFRIEDRATLGGMLEIDATMLQPVLGQRFVLIQAEQIDGAFDVIHGIRIDENYRFYVQQTKTELSVVVGLVEDHELDLKPISRTDPKSRR
ncbi:MAG: sulfatase-like hydrolase/transferase [Planctomycetota bacterium]